MDSNAHVSSYLDTSFIYPLGSARTILACSFVTTGDSKSYDQFSIIVDSGATAMMMPFRQCFISYKDTPHSYVILANNQKSPCLGRGIICINMEGHNIILRDVLHVPSL